MSVFGGSMQKICNCKSLSSRQGMLFVWVLKYSGTMAAGRMINVPHNESTRQTPTHAAEKKHQHLSPTETGKRPPASPVHVVAQNSWGKKNRIKDKSINDIKATPKINTLTGFI